ncbi:hypothetical protein COLO4_07635 [Corchorus olitorius]|uniref:FAR1 domain-containing protein n=1 Tax=Corchorus olitorius TaxID=93759 RepID=A0A1R3KJ33_9ROSI|nr:hypothetical protein COLO4_07635 [Corchorus olitorius]
MDEEEIIQEPKIGMTFASSEEAHGYYSNYAKQEGFGVIKRTSKRNDDGLHPKAIITDQCKAI